MANNRIADLYFSFDEKRNYTQQSPAMTLTSQSSATSSSSSSMRVFSKLRKLVLLDLSGNRISHIAANSLPRSLVTVDLSRNLLTAVPLQALQHMRDLRILSLKDNLLGNWRQAAVTGAAAAVPATVVDSDVGALLGVDAAELMNNRLHLEKLDLSLNALEELPAKWFEVESIFRVKAINFDRNFIRHVPGGAFQHAGLVHIILAFNRIESIDEDAFAGLEHSLEYLDLERNFLVNVSSAFGELQRIRYIYLTANQLDSLEVSLPGTLRVLSLSSNNFSQIPVTGLDNCTELSYLNLGYNKIADLPENSFVGWGAEIQTLLLRNNKIASLNYGSFNGLEAIKEISLSFNDIHYLHPSTFHNISKTLKILELSFGMYRDDIPYEALNTLTELMWLGLDNNNFKFIPDDSLLALHELTYINLAFNRISILPRTIFMPQIHRNLMEIDLSFNQIERVSTNTFDELVLLQFVNLQANRVRTVERHSFHNLPYLTFVDLSHNDLRNVSEAAFAFLPNLLTLDLTHNQLTTLSLKMFRHVSNFTTPLHVNCSHNQLTHVDGDVGSHLFIHTLDLSDNQLAETTGFGNLRDSLRFLYLRRNNISLLHNAAFGDLAKLVHLDLASNNVSQLRRRSFAGLTNLQELDLSDNKLEALQFEQFANLKRLRVLNLSRNRLRSIPRDSFVNTRLEVIDLSDNQLPMWPVSAISDVGFTLRAIHVDGNQLEYLDASMFGNVNFLLKLSLARNRITVLPDNTFVHLMNLTELNLSRNPLVVTNFRELFSYLPRLRRLWMRATELTVLPSMIGVPEVEELDLGENALVEVAALRDLPRLRVLRLDQNKFTNLSHFGKWLPTRLSLLDISYNPIRKLTQHDFGQLRYLDELGVQDLKLPVEIFGRLRNLKTLYISMQAHLGEIVSRLRSLRQLRVSVLVEESVPPHLLDALINNTKLNLVELSGHSLKAIPASAFNGLARSQDLTIRIANTQINDLPPGLFYALKYVPRLTIDISNNLIATLAPDTFYPNSSAWDAVGTRSIIGGLDVYGNPLQCDCGLVWVGHWLRRWLRESAQISPISKEDTKKMLEVGGHSLLLGDYLFTCSFNFIPESPPEQLH